VLAPGIGGSVGDATYQLARAQGAGKVISTAGSAAKAARAHELGCEGVAALTELVVETFDPYEYAKLLRPLLDQIVNAAGRARTPSFDHDGRFRVRILITERLPGPIY
jgi:NADPH:quinone reductase-like Zn-dependent oxidoreductase